MVTLKYSRHNIAPTARKEWLIRIATAPYLERAAPKQGAFDRAVLAAWGRAQASVAPPRAPWRQARHIRTLAEGYARLSAPDLLAQAGALRSRLLHGRSREAESRAFAMVHAAVEHHLGLRYHGVQVIGGLALTGRRVVEMATGEGKTITAALPAATAALGGAPVHIVTVNDYLATRDSERLRPVFAALGLTTGLVVQGQEREDRRRAYAADIVYVTNKELTFDYLRDGLTTANSRGGARQAVAAMLAGSGAGLLLRGLHVAIIDEADSVLIDEARTPLIISADREEPEMAETMGLALGIAQRLTEGDHYAISRTENSVILTPAGVDALSERSEGLPGLFRSRHARHQLMLQALTALYLFQRDRHYIVGDDGVQIVDEYTGRVMPDRTWEAGLHQLIEAKEGVALTSPRETLARITYQRFFNRYLRLSGMTGTGAEVAGELRAVYGLSLMRVPTNRRIIRRHLGATIYPAANARWQAVAAQVQRVAVEAKRPVLVGTQSVEASEALSAVLDARGIGHAVLNARQDAVEAEIIARAGHAGQVTVATNMAGRGTDIVLGPGVKEAGGLHVILTGFHDSTRIDRQLYGRAGRQGDPGSCEAAVALDDELFRRFAPGTAATLGRYAAGSGPGAKLAAWLLRRRAQAAASGLNSDIRRQQMAADEQLATGLSFARRE